MFYNEHEVTGFVALFNDQDSLNLFRLATTVENLMGWTNRNSDGWPYWQAPRKAAAKALALLDAKARDYREDGCRTRVVDGKHVVVQFTDATEAEVRRALTPIKSFLTKHDVDHERVIAP